MFCNLLSTELFGAASDIRVPLQLLKYGFLISEQELRQSMLVSMIPGPPGGRSLQGNFAPKFISDHQQSLFAKCLQVYRVTSHVY